MAGAGYILMIPSIGYATYFRSHVAFGRPDADAVWGITVACALLAAGTLGPFIGAYADQVGARRRIIAVATLIAAAFTALLTLTRQGDIVIGAALFVVAHVAFLLAKAIYDSYLPQLGKAGSLPLLSGVSWGLGYIGSIACFLLCLPLIRGGAEQSDPATFRLAFLVTAGFFAALAVPALLWFPADEARQARRGGSASAVVAQVLNTIRQWREQREVFKFLIAFYLINDAVVTFLIFIGIYLKVTFGLSVESILRLTLVFYAIGIPATIAFGWLGRTWSERGAVYLSLAIWLGLICLLAVGENAGVPLAATCVAGLVIGSTQALCRSIYARIIPPEQASEFFGFNAFVGRASAALGPLAFGFISAATGSQRAAMGSLAGVFVLGGLALFFVRLQPQPQTGAAAVKA